MKVLNHSTRLGVHAAEVEAVWEDAGLAVNKSVRGWNITHVGSGYAIAKGLTSSERAVHVAGHLLTLGDWCRPASEVRVDEDLHKETKALCDRLQREGYW